MLVMCDAEKMHAALLEIMKLTAYWSEIGRDETSAVQAANQAFHLAYEALKLPVPPAPPPNFSYSQTDPIWCEPTIQRFSTLGIQSKQ